MSIDQILKPSDSAPLQGEAPPEQPVIPVEPQKEPVSPKFEVLAKREAALVKKQQELKRMEESIKAQEERYKELESKYNSYEGIKKSAKLNPLAALQELGLTYEELTDYQLRGGVPAGEQIAKSVQEQLSEFKKQHEQELKSQREEQERRAKESQEQQLAEFKDNMTDFIQNKSDEFELTNLYKAYDLVYSTIVQHWEATNKVLTVQEAAELTEKYLEEEAEKTLKTKKFSSRFSQSPQKGEQAKEPSLSPKTLNNSMVTGASPSTLPSLTEAERIKRALAALG